MSAAAEGGGVRPLSNTPGHPAVTAATESLAHREEVIARGLSTFIEVGRALCAIRDDQQYREIGFDSFDAYCGQRWGMRREVADRHIRAAQVVATVNPLGLPNPSSESVARELAPLKGDTAQAQAAWAEAVEQHGPKPTAKQTRKVVQKHRAPKTSSKPAKPATDVAGVDQREQVIVPPSESGEAGASDDPGASDEAKPRHERLAEALEAKEAVAHQIWAAALEFITSLPTEDGSLVGDGLTKVEREALVANVRAAIQTLYALLQIAKRLPFRQTDE